MYMISMRLLRAGLG